MLRGRALPDVPLRAAAAILVVAGLAVASGARAGTFDAAGDDHLDPAAVVADGFAGAPDRYLLPGTSASCTPPMFTLVSKPDALEGESYLTLDVLPGCAERFLFTLPGEPASYAATVWMRHGGLNASLVVDYTSDSGLDGLAVQMTPTGRTTSDGWVELASNPFPVDGAHVLQSYLKVVSFSAENGVDLDAFEIVKDGVFTARTACSGLGDAACGPDEVCIYSRCIFGPAQVPVLPSEALRDGVVDVLEGQLRTFFGGRFSRASYLPAALAQMELMRGDTRAWPFWSHFASAVHALHDWHTDTDMSVTGLVGARHRLNACFFEGDADLSHDVAPTDPAHADVLVAYSGPEAAGLKAGDRLLAVDGVHPLVWAASLANANWGFHIADDPANEADLAEALGGPTWTGGALIATFAHDFTVLRCDPGGACDGPPETVFVTDLPDTGVGSDLACDNRPFYHFDPANNPDPTTHYVFGTFFRGMLANTSASEGLFGMVWDTLDGQGSPTSPVNTAINQAVADWTAGARGVILDHRAGNGGTLDAATNLTTLARPPSIVAVTRMPIEIAGYGGPADAAEGLSIFTGAEDATPYSVGASAWAAGLPVALILHRDGSASDYMPYGMKGAPNVRLFGPHQTAGAFSTFIELSGWGTLYWQFASGDTVAADGHALLGQGVMPDVVMLPKQSDLLAGKDTLYEAALAWLRQETGP